MSCETKSASENWSEQTLSGEGWRLTHCLPGEFSPVTGINPGAVGDTRGPDWTEAVVPGDVQSDALDAGWMPDPNLGLNSRSCEWTYQRDWVYTRTFRVDRPAELRDRVLLQFDGVDYQCDVFLNEQWLGRHEGAWTPFEFDVTDALCFDGENTLVVVVSHAPDEQCQWGRTSLVRTTKARFAYGWDWCTRLVPLGIWKEVRLIARGPAHLADVFAWPVVELEGPTASVEVEATIPAECELAATLSLTLSLDGKVVAEANVEAKLIQGENRISARLDVPDPQLWYPNGYGEQPVYRLACTLNEPAGALDTRSVPVGLRKIEWRQTDGAPEDALPYSPVVNGRRVFLKGWNWAPIRQLYGRVRQDVYRRRVELAARANANVLRVWSGGLPEREEFYNLCDELGILVWQETFMSSCCIDNHPSCDPEYVELLCATAEVVIRQKRNHPSLAIWCGGNELSIRGDTMDVHGNVLRPDVAGWEGYKVDVSGQRWIPLAEDYPVLQALGECVRKLDPDRLWLPCSGSGPWENACTQLVGKMHDVHGPWIHMGPAGHYEFYNTVDMMLHAEFGCDGAASVRSIERFVPPGFRWPIDATNTHAWHHGRMWTVSNRHRTEEWFGPIDDLATYVRASQYIQAEGLHWAAEAHRRRKWKSAGCMPWHFAEPWPNACDTCCVDVWDQPKPAYYALGRAYRPVHVSAKYATVAWADEAKFQAEVWGHNATNADLRGTLTTTLLAISGEELAVQTKAVTLAAEDTQPWDTITLERDRLPELFVLVSVLRDKADCERSRHWSLHSTAIGVPLASLRNLPPAKIEVTRQGDTLQMTNVGQAPVVGLWLETSLDEKIFLSDNYLCILPGETWQVSVQGSVSELHYSAWNVPENKL